MNKQIDRRNHFENSAGAALRRCSFPRNETVEAAIRSPVSPRRHVTEDPMVDEKALSIRHFVPTDHARPATVLPATLTVIAAGNIGSGACAPVGRRLHRYLALRGQRIYSDDRPYKSRRAARVP